jgi:hypothetical protein
LRIIICVLRQGFTTPKFLGIAPRVTPRISLALRSWSITPLSFLSLGKTWKQFPDGHGASPPLDQGLISPGFAFLTTSKWNAPKRSLQFRRRFQLYHLHHLRHLHRSHIQPAALRKQWTSLKIGYYKFLKL